MRDLKQDPHGNCITSCLLRDRGASHSVGSQDREHLPAHCYLVGSELYEMRLGLYMMRLGLCATAFGVDVVGLGCHMTGLRVCAMGLRLSVPQAQQRKAHTTDCNSPSHTCRAAKAHKADWWAD